MEVNPIKLTAISLAQGNVDKAKHIELYLTSAPTSEPELEKPVQIPSDIGNSNSGNSNSGNSNSGNSNSGNSNSGHWNSGDCNSGDCNSGHWNSGHRNSGDCNSGHWNSGHRNSGHRNSGHWNSGHWNSGHRNSGECNSGHWNSGDWNSGYFNTETPELITVFDKPCMKSVWDSADKPTCLNFSLTKWISESEMSDVEKQKNPSYSHTGGYLKVFTYKEAFSQSVKAATKAERDLIRALPNFNNDKFLEISGVDLRELDKEQVNDPNQ